ncbi:hypothetical protein AB0K16_53915 [Nonomuraea jabiensis]|uniref:hypothetical protein n=1 Tax=Nonomuraea jabiensis TaxID=882448 RepID=UPI003447F9A2
MNGWTLVYDGSDPGGEGTREALRTLGNGRFATRGREWFRPERAARPAYRHELDPRPGVLVRDLRGRDGEGRIIRVRQRAP